MTISRLPQRKAQTTFRRTDEGNNRTDWAEVTTGINQSIQDAIARYQGGDAKNAILDIQDTYFDRFEASGMENKIGSRDSAFKTTTGGVFYPPGQSDEGRSAG